MFKLKARYYWIFSLICLIISVGLMLLIIFGPKNLNKLCIVSLTVFMILFTLSFQFAITRTMASKEYKRSFIVKEFESKLDINEILESNEFILREKNYGKSYIKIIDNVAYKVVLINNVNDYFKEDDDNSDNSLAKKLDKCHNFVSFEIFEELNQELEKRIVDFTIKTDKLYLTAFVRNDKDNYVCLNYEEPNNNYINYLYDLIGLKEIEDSGK